MASGLAADVAGAGAHLLTSTADEAASQLHKQAATRMAKVFGEMKGLPLKAGQMLSFIDEFIPEEHRSMYADILGQLQNHTPSVEWTEMEALFRDEFDGLGPDEVFASFDTTPFAAASIGQVYRATLHDGTDAVVKIQYPGVVEAFESDLANLDVLVGTISHIIPKADFAKLFEDITHRVIEEVDYEHERANQMEFAALWKGDPQIIVPRTFPEYCRSRVLVSEYLSGSDWADMLQQTTPQQRSDYGVVIFRFVFESLFRHGLFNGDPHPGNYLFQPDGKVAFIDFGCVQHYDEDQAIAFRELREALLSGAPKETFRALLFRCFGVPTNLDPTLVEVLEEYIHRTFEPITDPQPYRFTREYSKAILAQTLTLKGEMTKKMIRGKNAYPLDLEKGDGGIVFLGRIVFGLASILATLDTTGEFRSIVESTR